MRTNACASFGTGLGISVKYKASAGPTSPSISKKGVSTSSNIGDEQELAISTLLPFSFSQNQDRLTNYTHSILHFQYV
jgi:hypothetical protein